MFWISQRCVPFLSVLLILVCQCGCATHALWDNGNLEAFNEPAANLNLRLFEAKSRNDLLVVYNEHSERNDKLRTRAYWLRQNQARVNQRRPPRFADTNLVHDFPSVPVFPEPVAGVTNPAPPLYAMVSTNQQSFTLYTLGQPTGSFDLPVYNDGRGRVLKITLTPISVVADITIIGGVVGCMYFEGLAESGSSISVR